MKDKASAVPNRGTQTKTSSHLFTPPRMACTCVISDSAVISAKVTSDTSSANLSTGGDVDHQVAARLAQPNNVPNGYGSPGVFPNAQKWATTTDAHMFNGPAGTW